MTQRKIYYRKDCEVSPELRALDNSVQSYFVIAANRIHSSISRLLHLYNENNIHKVPNWQLQLNLQSSSILCSMPRYSRHIKLSWAPGQAFRWLQSPTVSANHTCSRRTTPWKLIHCCFKSLNFEVIRYTALASWNKTLSSILEQEQNALYLMWDLSRVPDIWYRVK